MMDTNSASNDKSIVSESGVDNTANSHKLKTRTGKVRITKDQVAHARKMLAGLKPVKKTKESQPGFSSQEFVNEMYTEILAASEKGYTLQQIAEMLTAQAKVDIPSSTLKNYMSKAKAERQKQNKGELAKNPPDTALSSVGQTGHTKIGP